MKARLLKQILIAALLTLILVPQTSIGQDFSIPTSSIKIDNHLIYVIQQTDLTTFKIDEYFYINNTGNTSFNDSFYMWVPDNSNIVAECCDDTPNMACRNDEREEMWCFYFNKTDDDNIYVGYPISSENKLSYYGQKESLTITAFSTTNISLRNDTLQLNVTIGGSYISREEESFQGVGVHITSENQEIGMTPWTYPYETFNITNFEKIRVFNNGSNIETIELSTSELPEGWKVEIWNDTNELNNISLLPQKFANLTLKIIAPSYLASIYVGVTTQMRIDGNETQGSFINKYLYETKKVSYNIYSLFFEGLEVSSDLIAVHEEPYWIEDYGLYWFYAKAENALSNNQSTIFVGLEKPLTYRESNPLIILLLVILLISIIVVIILKKKDFFKEEDTVQKRETPPKKRKEELLEKKKKHSEIKDTPEKKEKELKSLEKQKKDAISAIKRVEREFENGVISKKDYEHFKTAYKKRAIEILKKIDEFEE